MTTNNPLPRDDFFRFSNVIDGKLRGGDSSQAVDPSTATALWDVPIATTRDVEDAIQSAKRAFRDWSATSWEARHESLRALRKELSQYHEQMAELIMREGGKPKQFAALEVEHALGFLDFFATQRVPEEEVIQDDDNLRLTLRYLPIGVVGAICPWNYPLVLAMGKIGAAILTGNCIIVKPSPYTPYSILKFAEMAQKVLPAGVLQAVNGDDSVGPMLTNHSEIGKISFTGSVETGKQIMRAASGTLKNITLELGGNNAAIVCEDVDIAKVAPQIAIGAFFNSGQLCVASKRIYVHEGIYAKFLQIFSDVVESWSVGPVSKDGIMLGPVQNQRQFEIVRSFFEDTAKNGYRFAVGGEFGQSEGYVVQPAVVDNPPDSSKIVSEEPFGPIVPILSWSSEEEVLARVNDTTTGLGGSVWTQDIARARRLAHRIEAGSIWINSFEKPLPQAYFSGHKESGVGGEWGTHGLLGYCNAQSIHYYK